MSAVLTIQTPTGASRELAIGNTATIGRLPGNDVVLPEPRSISRQHAIIRCLGAREYQIMDLGSRNGTFVDGNRVVLPVTLRENSSILIEGNELVFRTVPEARWDPMEDITIANTAPWSQAGNRERDVAILVCDIRGFSTFSEKMEPALMARILGNWCREAANAVHEAGGVIDKFIGDALLAYWTDLPGDAVACERALDTAGRLLEMAAARTWPDPVATPFRIGIAMHHGLVSHGNIGIVAQRDATIIGDAVNVAFRLEGLMKSLGVRAILSEPFHRNLRDTPRFTDHGEHLLKGKSRPMRVFGME